MEDRQAFQAKLEQIRSEQENATVVKSLADKDDFDQVLSDMGIDLSNRRYKQFVGH